MISDGENQADSQVLCSTEDWKRSPADFNSRLIVLQLLHAYCRNQYIKQSWWESWKEVERKR